MRAEFLKISDRKSILKPKKFPQNITKSKCQHCSYNQEIPHQKTDKLRTNALIYLPKYVGSKHYRAITLKLC